MKDRMNPLLRIFIYVILGIGVIFSSMPFLWMVLTSFKPSGEIFGTSWLPTHPTLENYRNLFRVCNFPLYYWNSFVIALGTVSLGLFFDSLGGFAFAKYRFPGRKILFWTLMATLMVPGQITLIPSYIVLGWLQLTNTLTALVVTAIVSAFGIFLVRQYMQQVIPDELIDAARIDGCNNFQIYYKIALPLSVPVLSALAIFRFLATWNNYLWPLIVLQDKSKYTLPVGIKTITGTHGIPIWGVQMAGSFLATLPIIIFFLLMQRQLISGIAFGALKE